MGLRGGLTAATVLGSGLACAGAAHAVRNARQLRRPPPGPSVTTRRVTVLVPARDEAARIGELVADLRQQRGVAALAVRVLDDASEDRTAEAATWAAASDPRIDVVRSTEGPPPGWLGKPAACHRLAGLAPADTDVLVFLDADVRLAAHAVAAAVRLLDAAELDLVSPWPRLVAHGWAERLVQPLNQWSWLTTLPLRVAERSPRPSLTAANGQFLVVRAAVYRRAGGHAAVPGAVLEDLALARAVKRVGGRVAPADGSALATCRMYRSAAELRDGYGKSLWVAFGSPAGALAPVAALLLAYLLPPLAALAGRGALRRCGLAGWAAGVASRAVAARATGGRAWPDALAHPLSMAAFAGLLADSVIRHRRGRLTWKGRPLAPAGPPGRTEPRRGP